MKKACKPSDMPKGPHYAVLVFETLSMTYDTPGDTSEEVCKYYFTVDRDEWVREISRLEQDNKTSYSKTAYQALVIKSVPEIRTSVVVAVDP